MKKETSTVIEITDTHFKLLQSKLIKDNRVMSLCEVKPIQKFTEQEIIKLLKESILKKNIHPDEITLVVPRRLTILKQMRLPSHNEEEIKKMIGLQLVNQIPYPLEDIVYDYDILEKDNGGYTQVLTIIVHKEVSDRYVHLFKKLGVNLSKLMLSSLGLLGWLIYQESRKTNRIQQPVALIDIDVVHTEICFCHNKKLLFSRNINYGARDLSVNNIMELFNQIHLSLETYRKDHIGPDLKKVLLLSMMPETVALKDKIEKELKISSEVLTPFDNILCHENINLSSIKEQLGVSLSVAFGVLLSDFKKSMNLIPQEVHDIKQINLIKRQWGKFFVLLLTTLILCFSIIGIEFYQKYNALKVLEEKAGQLAPKIKMAKEKIKFVKDFRREFQQRIFLADLINTLNALTPAEISIRSLEIAEDRTLTLQGYAQTTASVNDFRARLVQSPVFKNVNQQFATQRKIFNLDLTDFKITCSLQDSKDQN